MKNYFKKVLMVVAILCITTIGTGILANAATETYWFIKYSTIWVTHISGDDYVSSAKEYLTGTRTVYFNVQSVVEKSAGYADTRIVEKKNRIGLYLYNTDRYFLIDKAKGCNWSREDVPIGKYKYAIDPGQADFYVNSFYAKFTS